MTALAVVLVALLLPLPAAPAAEPVPEGCAPLDPETYSCRWVFEALPPQRAIEWQFPTFPRTLATFSVTLLQAPDSGWTLRILDPSGEEVSRSRHNPNPVASVRHTGESTHVLMGDAGAHILELTVGESTSGLRTTGRYEVAYLGRAVPDGVVPSRPAASREDPHFRDPASDVEEPSWDIRAAWFGDARLGDGLMDAHLQVGDLANLTTAAFRAPTTEGPGGQQVFQVDELSWKIAWSVGSKRYYVEWALPRPASNATTYSCVLKTEMENEQLEEVLAHPLCEVDRAAGTFHATFPEASIGSPPDGQVFEAVEVRSRARYLPTRAIDTLDDRGEVRYAFALGGPSVWSSLNPRLDPPPVAWYEDPLAPENVADTLQVAGSLAALATFLVGLALVSRRRRQTSRLLARVDALDAKGVDSAQTLVLLGQLEQEFNELFRRHRISEAQYQVLSQRIAGVATRFALRRSLGLDDGVPGEAGPGVARRIPVQGEPDRVRRQN